jgi:hypothetical protein
MRVHVHRSVDRIWLMPSRFSIRYLRPDAFRDVALRRPAIFFTVATTGDSTFSEQLQMLPADHFDVRPNHLQNVRIPATASAGDTIAVMCAAWGNHSPPPDSHESHLLEAWAAEPHVPSAELISGHPHVLHRTKPPDDLPNVLFVACASPARIRSPSKRSPNAPYCSRSMHDARRRQR